MSQPVDTPIPLSARWKGTFVGVLVLVATIVCSGVLHFRAMGALQHEVQDKLMRTAMAIAARIDGDLHRTFTDPSQETGEDYARAIKPLEEALYWRKDGQPVRTDYRYVYTCIQKEDGTVYFILDATPPGQMRPDGVEEKSHIMQAYHDASPEMLAALRTGEPQADREPYSDQWGVFVSGYAPFYDSSGKRVGVVGVDWKAETYAERLSGIRRAWYLQMFLCLVSGFLSGVGTGVALVRRERVEAAKRHAIEEARRNRERWRIMVETLPKPAAHLQDGEFWINEPLEKCLGYRRDQITSLDAWFERLWGEEAEAVRALYEADRAAGFSQSREFQVKTADGQIKCMEFTAHVYSPGEVWLLEDVTAKKAFQARLIAAREEAETAMQARSMLLATVSHEIRTPMNGVIGMTNLLLDSPLAEHQREMAETIRTSGKALIVVINDILDYSKIEAGGMELESEPFDLRECVEDCLDLFAGMAGEKNLTLVGLLADDLPTTIYGDCSRLRQVLCNLIGNAVKFTERGEVELRVDVERPPENGSPVALRFTIRDTGIGIPAERQGRLFRNFTQADSSTARKYGGTGLGLAISRSLVELMGGTISVESRVGEGSVFSFTLSAPVDPLNSLGLQPSAVLAGRRVVIVKAHEGTAQALVRALQRAGMSCDEVQGGTPADAALAAGHGYDLVILDLEVTERGFGWWEQQRRAGTELPPCLAIASHLTEELLEKARSAGINRVLQRPVRTATLWQAARTALAPATPADLLAANDMRAMAKAHPLRILVVEDDSLNRQVALRIFGRFGYEADLAASGLEGIELARRKTYDVVFMDIEMSGLNGYETTARIRESAEAGRVPWFVALTANTMPEARDVYLRHGMNDYVAKPIALADLERALKAVPKRVDD